MNTSYFKRTLIGIIGIVFLLALLILPGLREHAIHTIKQPVSGWLLPLYF